MPATDSNPSALRWWTAALAGASLGVAASPGYWSLVAWVRPRQVRNTVGSLIRVGTGQMAVKEFEQFREAKTPGLAGPAAPPHGLYLINVDYPDTKFDKGQIDENI